jgi:hypothetical protein
MKAVNKKAQKVLEQLTWTLTEPGSYKRFDRSHDIYMPVHVNWVAGEHGDFGRLISVAHYVEAEGDLLPDPMMEFLQGPDMRFYPVSADLLIGYHSEPVRLADDLRPIRFDPKEQADLVQFANDWMKNIWHQQFEE